MTNRVRKRAQYEAFEFELQNGDIHVRNGSYADPVEAKGPRNDLKGHFVPEGRENGFKSNGDRSILEQGSASERDDE